MIVVYLPFFAVGAVLLVLPTASQSCSVPLGWREMSLNQRVSLADIVVHAKALNKTKTPQFEHGWPEVYDGTMEVYCVLKGGPLSSDITVVEMGYIGGHCTANEVNIDEEYILLLSRRDNGTFLPDNVNVQAAVIQATQENIDNIALTCGLQNFTLPLDVAGNAPEQRGCPTHPNESGKQCVGAGAASHIVMSTNLIIFLFFSLFELL
ncbi:PREDICTED: uncharacterized protein LOC109478687 [Branchiostoma belcheri]|uniref:Uncharacterized protein LOC109478687 n=1 Tax=Branchiostoma belcheri TaxID=7741 RepID=A0A6P4ZGP4_BRABE|nr:PREDICTED: uncharacterized protein LOC109478687 [Branchiostoma belcheri]XP_019635914.1 PREDICTED: uncharacterized protein LOC109478687 [Branchiostoma belcheri]